MTIGMEDVLNIGEVASATGLTIRALRFYEARGLVSPLRTAGGRRIYGAADLARLDAAVALKRAGFSLARIADLLAGRTVDLRRLVKAQLAEVDAQAAALTQSRALLRSVMFRLDRNEAIDVATLCSLIRTGMTIMDDGNWKAIIDDYFTSDEQHDFKARMIDVPGGFDQPEYRMKWKGLADRISAALPLDPTSAEAQALVDEWFALLKPFSQIATPAMWCGTVRMYDGMDEWKQRPDMGFDKQVWTFVTTATKARIAAGGAVDGPAWVTDARA